MDIEGAVATVDRALLKAAGMFKRDPATILTEGDLKCWIFTELSRTLGEPKPTADRGISTPSLHAEISWFDADGRLRLRPDITILEPEQLSVLHGMAGRIALPTKGAHFKGSAILIEFKFCHSRKGISPTMLKDFRADVSKMREIASRHTAPGISIITRCVLFSRYRHRSAEIELLERENQAGNVRVMAVDGDLTRADLNSESARPPTVREVWSD